MTSYQKVLGYHSINNSSNHTIYKNNIVDKRLFEQQITYILDNYTIIPLYDMVQHIKNGNKRTKNLISITFDDGYEDFYTNVYPIIKAYGIPVTVFLNAKYIEHKFNKWDDLLTTLHNIYCDERILFDKFKDIMPVDLFETFRDMISFLKWTEPRQLTDITSEIERMCDNLRLPKNYMTWEQIICISRDKNITIGSHSLSHYNLTVLDNNTLRHELRQGRELLEQKIGVVVNGLCYPFGFYNDLVKRYAYEEGYIYAVSCGDRYNTSKTDLFEIQRILVTNSSIDDFKKRMSTFRYTIREIKRNCIRRVGCD